MPCRSPFCGMGPVPDIALSLCDAATQHCSTVATGRIPLLMCMRVSETRNERESQT